MVGWLLDVAVNKFSLFEKWRNTGEPRENGFTGSLFILASQSTGNASTRRILTAENWCKRKLSERIEWCDGEVTRDVTRCHRSTQCSIRWKKGFSLVPIGTRFQLVGERRCSTSPTKPRWEKLFASFQLLLKNQLTFQVGKPGKLSFARTHFPAQHPP